jgi:hypothetical protein
MSIPKRTLAAGAAVAAIGLMTAGTVGLASAATSTADTGSNSIVEKLATKFNLNKEDVQAVFDEEHKAHKAEMQQRQQERLTQAVEDGKLTQEQADHITQVRKEIEALLGDARPNELGDEVHEQIKQKIEALHDWAKENDVDLLYVKAGGPGFGGPKHLDGQDVMMHTEISGGNNDQQ